MDTKTKHIKRWIIKSAGKETKTEVIKTKALGTIRVIKPSELGNSEYAVVGSINASRKRFTQSKAAVVLGSFGGADVFFKVPFSRLLGYLPTTEAGCYIAVRKKRIAVILLLGILLAGLLASGVMAALNIYAGTQTPFSPILDPLQEKLEERSEISAKKDVEYMDVIGIPQIFVWEAEQSVQLGNPAENNVLFKYTVYGESGSELFKSGWIEPGMAAVWNVWNSFEGKAGTYSVTILVSAQNPYTGKLLNSAQQSTTVTVQ